jgi:hypothetical protein
MSGKLRKWPIIKTLDPYPDHFPYGDVYPLASCGHNCITTHPAPCQFHKNTVLPLGNMELLGIKVSIPAQPQRMMEVIYGKNWLKPPSDKSIHGLKNVYACLRDNGGIKTQNTFPSHKKAPLYT